ncbi:MAG: DUF1648 domain-containing protein [Bacteroidota bacterium]|nr:DUF1648 domain-containing protein [Bacteroidota bacterium]
MESNPELKIQLALFDKIIEGICWLMFVVVWFIPIFYYTQLPEVVPLRFAFDGTVVGWGNKRTILVLPVIFTFVFILLSTINYYPNTFNYLVKINKDNALKQYKLATRFIRYIKLIISIMFAFIVFDIAQMSLGSNLQFRNWIPFYIVIFILIPVGIQIYLSIKNK